jgi:hypothetical protein
MIGSVLMRKVLRKLHHVVRKFWKLDDATGMPDDEYLELRYDLGRTFEEIGKYKDAKKAYEGICEINIKFKDTMEKIMEMTRKIETVKEPEDTDPKLIEFTIETE